MTTLTPDLATAPAARPHSEDPAEPQAARHAEFEQRSPPNANL